MNLDMGQMFEHFADLVAEHILSKMSSEHGAGGSDRVPRRLLSVDAAAIYLGRSKDAVQHLIQADKLPVVRCDRRTMLDIRDLDEWIAENKSGGGN